MEASYACTPPFSQESLWQMASLVVEASTEDRVAASIAARLALLAPATIIAGTYPLLQGVAVLLTAVYAAGRGIVHANPYVIAILLEQNLLLVDVNGNVSTVLGGHYVVANPYVPADRLIFTGYGKILLSTIQRVSTFDHLTNEQREGAERHLLAAFNDCGARQVIVSA
jgi:hypothetical protein